MEKKLDLIFNELQNINQRIQNIESGQKELNQMVRVIHDRQEETDAKLESLTLDVHKVHGELSSLKQGQERQEKILETLALRSIEQESELREVKRAK